MTSSKQRLLSPEVLDKAARCVIDVAKIEGVPAAIGGGFALQLYGSPRLTGDIDVVALRRLMSLPQGEPLSFGGYRSEVDGVPVDIILRDDDFASLYDQGLLCKRTVEGLPVLPAEYLAAMKMVAGRHKDLADLEFLIGEGVIDMTETRSIVRRFLGPYAVKELNSFAEETLWRRTKGK